MRTVAGWLGCLLLKLVIPPSESDEGNAALGWGPGDHCSARLFWLRPEATTGQATQQYGSLRLLLIDLLCLRVHMQM